ncbi:MAG: hypothetical protein K1X35_08845 [Caulobacteraceae bacterium]|nr:hypothetical protein [Caulobacteraceae bacterium]
MTKERYWVVGGDYSCTEFNSLRGQAQAIGPFEERGQAEQAWRELSRENRSRATARYAITAEQIRMPG